PPCMVCQCSAKQAIVLVGFTLKFLKPGNRIAPCQHHLSNKQMGTLLSRIEIKRIAKCNLRLIEPSRIIEHHAEEKVRVRIQRINRDALLKELDRLVKVAHCCVKIAGPTQSGHAARIDLQRLLDLQLCACPVPVMQNKD